MKSASASRSPQRKRSDYVHFQATSLRWKDNDVYGHVNNAEYYSYFDTVINTWLITRAGLNFQTGPTIGLCVESNCRFFESLSFPDTIDIGLRVATIGLSSVRYELGLFPAGQETAAAEGWFVHVFVDRERRRPAALGQPMRNALYELVVTETQ